MKNEYIRREDVLKGQKTGTFANGICFEAKRCVPVEYIESLEPAADVIPVVFCKYCQKRRKDGYCVKFFQNIRGIGYAWYMPQDDDFCSYGERREE